MCQMCRVAAGMDASKKDIVTGGGDGGGVLVDQDGGKDLSQAAEGDESKAGSATSQDGSSKDSLEGSVIRKDNERGDSLKQEINRG